MPRFVLALFLLVGLAATAAAETVVVIPIHSSEETDLKPGVVDLLWI